MAFSNTEKETIFVNRTKEKYASTWEHYCSIISHETMTEEEMKEYNFRQRQKIVKYAYENTIFYKKLYDKAGFKPEDLKTEDDWNRIPTITKEMVRENFDDMIVGGKNGELAKKHGALLSTGGSTGQPLPIMRDMRYEQAGSTLWRSRGWWVGRPKGELSGGEAPVLGQNEGIIWRMKGMAVKNPDEREAEKTIYYPMIKYYLDSQNLTKENMQNFIDEIDKDGEGLVFLRGFCGAVVDFARYCCENHINLRPKAVSVVSCPLDAIGRRIMKEAFGCEAYDVYGSKECQNMAHECRMSEHHLHVLSDLRHIDILDSNNLPVKGEEDGIVHITSFNNYIMPFIRYNLKDRTHFINRQCRCGLPFPLIHRISGRETDYILDKNGVNLYGPDSYVYSKAQSISGYQFIVHQPGKVTMKLWPNKAYSGWEDEVESVKKFYNKHYQNRIDFDYEIVDYIPHDDGKLRYIINLYEK